jgi:hypothetical protein
MLHCKEIVVHPKIFLRREAYAPHIYFVAAT